MQTLNANQPTAPAASADDKVAQLTVRAKAKVKAWEDFWDADARKLYREAAEAKSFLKTLKSI